jgi:hypothetical protein
MITNFKIFESQKGDFKKYMIWNCGAKKPAYVYILKFVSVNKTILKYQDEFSEFGNDYEIKTEVIDKYSFLIKSFLVTKKGFRYISTNDLNDIIYQSDDIQDCLDLLPILASGEINKYNI